MRIAILMSLIGSVLFGCSGSGQPGTNGNDGGATQSPSANSVPTISGNPSPGIKFNETYSFKPDAADADADVVTFKIQNKPDWATFNPTTGLIYGRPTLGDVGLYDGIIISVSDGKSSASLPSFSIAVSQSALGAVTLNWNPPTQNADGSPLRDLAGYKIYYRRNSGSYNQGIRIGNPGITTYVVDNLSPGTYYFSATAFNASGLESFFSAEIVRTVD